jgi:transposase
VMLLPVYEGMADREAGDRLAFDLRWKAAAGVAVADGSFHPTVLVGMQNDCGPERPRRLFEDVNVSAGRQGFASVARPPNPSRPGRPGRATGLPPAPSRSIGSVVVATLETTPKNATHWSRSKMAQRSGLSKSSIGRIWRAFELKPHRAEGFKLSNDPLFVDKVFDVVGLYLNPPEAAVVLCVDEKSQVQALARSQPAFPMMPGMPEKRTHDYVRHGTTSLFAAFNTTDGTVISSLHRRHRTVEFKKFLTKIDAEVPAELDVHLVCDNYGTHKSPAIRTWLTAHPRFHMHYTPTYSSWINQVERWFAYLTDDLLRRSDHRSVQALEKDIRNWIKAWNQKPRPFIWIKTAEQILDSLGRLLKPTNGGGH